MSDFSQYRRTAIAEMAAWQPGFDMAGVSVSDADRIAGSPKSGDMVARNPANHNDRWLVAAAYFAANFEAVETACSLGEDCDHPWDCSVPWRPADADCHVCDGTGYDQPCCGTDEYCGHGSFCEGYDDQGCVYGQLAEHEANTPAGPRSIEPDSGRLA